MHRYRYSPDVWLLKIILGRVIKSFIRIIGHTVYVHLNHNYACRGTLRAIVLCYDGHAFRTLQGCKTAGSRKVLIIRRTQRKVCPIFRENIGKNLFVSVAFAQILSWSNNDRLCLCRAATTWGITNYKNSLHTVGLGSIMQL